MSPGPIYSPARNAQIGAQVTCPSWLNFVCNQHISSAECTDRVSGCFILCKWINWANWHIYLLCGLNWNITDEGSECFMFQYTEHQVSTFLMCSFGSWPLTLSHRQSSAICWNIRPMPSRQTWKYRSRFIMPVKYALYMDSITILWSIQSLF